MPYIYHTEDGGDLLVDFGDLISLRTTYSVGKTLLKIGVGQLEFNSDKNSIPTVFVCTACNHKVALSDISARCGICGDVHPLKDLFKYENTPTLVCEKCGQGLEVRGYESSSSNKIPATKVFSKISITRR